MRRTSSCCRKCRSRRSASLERGAASGGEAGLLRHRRVRRRPLRTTRDGSFVADEGSKDAFGHTQLGGVAPVIAGMVRARWGYKYHWAVADYLQALRPPHRLRRGCRAGLRPRPRRRWNSPWRAGTP